MGRRQSITVNGVTYKSLDDVPEPERSQVRGLLADEDGDGIPDIVQGRHPELGGDTVASVTIETSEFVVDGVTYDSLDDVPEPQRSLIHRELEGALPDRAVAAGARSSATPAGAMSSHAPVVSRAGWSNRSKLLAAFVVVDLAVLALVVVVLTR